MKHITAHILSTVVVYDSSRTTTLKNFFLLLSFISKFFIWFHLKTICLYPSFFLKHFCQTDSTIQAEIFWDRFNRIYATWLIDHLGPSAHSICILSCLNVEAISRLCLPEQKAQLTDLFGRSSAVVIDARWQPLACAFSCVEVKVFVNTVFAVYASHSVNLRCPQPLRLFFDA